MISFGFKVPEEVVEEVKARYYIVFILEPDNMRRMKEADPFEMLLSDSAKASRIEDARLVETKILIAYEESRDAITEFYKGQNLPGLLAYLERGWKTEGDDGAAMKILEKN